VLQRAQEYSAGISDVCQNLGLAAAAQGHYDEASRYFREAVTIAEESGDDWQINVCLFYLGKIALLKGDYMEAQHCATEALAICTRHDFPLGTAEHAADLGILNVWKLGNYATAQRLLQESRDRLVEIGPAPWRTTTIVTFLATAYRELGEVDQAAYCYHEALSRTGSMTVGKAIMTAEILAHLGVLLTRMGEPEKALEMLVSTMKANESGSLTAREAYPVALQEIRIRIEEAMASLRLHDSLPTLRVELEARFGAEVVSAALAKGDAPSLEAIAAVALAV
jgi:tetratricopeptide (TPR) repeat protein